MLRYERLHEQVVVRMLDSSHSVIDDMRDCGTV
jgi:hypothetical protein